jgi:hypothetical protein
MIGPKLKKILIGAVVVVIILALFAARILVSRGVFVRHPAQQAAPAPSGTISWEDADKHYGQVVKVSGKIVAAYNNGKVCFLNFHKNWKEYFTVVIFSSDFGRFPSPPEDIYLSKEIIVTGFIRKYNDKPEMIVKDPTQIEVIK